MAAHQTLDGRFAYEAEGSVDAPPLVFLHGIGGAARAFRAQLEHFAGRFRTIAWDMPGYGGSAPLGSLSIPGLADALLAFLAALDLRRPVLVGHSIGGMIVQQALAAHPAIARAVVLAQTSPAFGSADGDWQRQFIEARLGPLDRGATMPALAAGLVAEMTGDAPDPDGVALARACMEAVSETTYRQSVRALLGFDQRAALGSIGVPTLVLAGTKDKNAPAPMMERMAGRIPGARYVALEGSGHLANLEQPARFNAVLLEFLDTLSPA
jgi:3-oxoadipate enol-lactonase